MGSRRSYLPLSSMQSDSDSTSLSEVEDNWSDKRTSFITTGSLSHRLQNNSNKHVSRKHLDHTIIGHKSDHYPKQAKLICDHSSAVRSEDVSDATATPSKAQVRRKNPSKMITGTIGGIRYVLPYETIEDYDSDTKAPPAEGQEQWAIESTSNSVETETVMRKKTLCGDFSFVKVNEPTSESDKKTSERSEIMNKTTVQSESDCVKLEVKSAKLLKIQRMPVHCPITGCQEQVCSSFFSSHLKRDHSQILRRFLDPGQTHTVLVDPAIEEYGVCHCNAVHYLGSKLRNFGSSEFKDHLPVLLMSTKFNFIDLDLADQEQTDRQQYMFWLTGIVSDYLKTEYTLTVGSFKCQRGFIHPLGQPQGIESVYRSGAGVIVSQQEVGRLLNQKDKLLRLRVSLK
ncbi:uncharacterized protein LOC131688551 [Topomyia yanbarensis]|uniref:uncharacterized protein LOC131688551 n=1 Tax=Topomyia yanbarensis TaxID=2498891 RepID=UPI00273AA66C|nr:uncharacterized protein LOC131688551 [Topomyia yanbarensis]